jgi:hypothetical protein
MWLAICLMAGQAKFERVNGPIDRGFILAPTLVRSREVKRRDWTDVDDSHRLPVALPSNHIRKTLFPLVQRALAWM